MKKLSKREVLRRVEERNRNTPDSKISLYPKSQHYGGQKAPLQFKCSKGHTWVSNFSNAVHLRQGCPHCKKVKEQQNKRTPYLDIKKQFDQLGYDYVYVEHSYVNSTSYMEAICSKHGKFKFIPRKLIKGKSKCPACRENEKNALRTTNFVKKASKLHCNRYDYSNVPSNIKPDVPVNILCQIHGLFTQRPSDHIQGHGCPSCSTRGFSRKQIYWLEEVAKNKNITIQHANNVGEFTLPGTNYRCDGYCKETNTVYEFHGDAFHGNPKRYAPGEFCHPFDKQITAQELYDQTLKKEKAIIDAGFNLETMWESEFDQKYLSYNPSNISPSFREGYLSYINHQVPTNLLSTLQITLEEEVFNGFKHKHTFRCNKCGNRFNTTLTQRKQAFKKYGSTGCSTCNKSKNTTNDILSEIAKKFGGQVKENVVYVTPHHAFYIKDLKENDKNSLLKLKRMFQQREVHLQIVFIDEWNSNKKLILNKIAHYVNLNNTTSKIHARQCIIKQIDNASKQQFLSKHHIQGNDNAKISYGAYHQDNLVAVMTFTKPRVALGYKNKDRSVYEGVWELSRFATDIDFRIPGIASKLLKFFQRENTSWKKIISYADARWSVGNLYEVLGFTLEHTNPPDYFYVINGRRKHRWNYRKDILKTKLNNYDPSITEYQNMEAAGYWRVWDCGTLRYVLTNEETVEMSYG